MARRTQVIAALSAGTLLLSACAVRLGGAKPEAYNAMGFHAAAGSTAASVAARIREAQSDVVLLSADQDSAWFADVATQVGIPLNGPGRTGPSSLGFLTRLKVLGDTSLIIPITDGGRLHVHDALFEVDKDRHLDLMLVSFAEATSVREGVRTLLNYIATDVGGTAALVLGIDAPSAAVADSARTLMRAAFSTAADCDDAPRDAPASSAGVTLFHGPEARLTCTDARIVPGSPPAVVTRVVVGR